MLNLKENLPQVGSKIFDFTIENDTIVCEFENELVDFIILPDETIRIGKGHFKMSNKSKEIIYAGRLKIVNGKIIYLDNDSGHYHPDLLDMNVAIVFLTERNLLDINCECKLI